ncbi:MAG TPA: hypothetical protein VI895_12715 [Bdellovibrionota bacterium]|nr:hypothetical protein [Bdellovibrionota bacterium]
MPYALLSFLWTSLVGVFLLVGSGLRLWQTANPLQTHVIFALSAVTLALFAHTMTMFYFIGTGKKIKDFMAEWEPEIRDEFRRRTIETKRKLFPWMLLSSGALMAAFILGGAADARVVQKTIHVASAYFALIAHVHGVGLETIHIFRNISLIHEINDLARRRHISAAASS